MTFVVAAVTPKSAWMMCDRRLSPIGGGAHRDDATKMMRLGTIDGDALVGYAGLGMTRGNTEPSDWLANVFRGTDASLEHSLRHLEKTAVERLSPHLVRLNIPGHVFIACGFKDQRPRIYTLELVLDFAARGTRHRLLRQVGPSIRKHGEKAERGPFVAFAGSGMQAITREESLRWARQFGHVLKAYDSGKVLPLAVAQYLAAFSQRVHIAAKATDHSVGNSCIVGWHQLGAEKGHARFSGVDRETPQEPIFLPTISRGTDDRALFTTVLWYSRQTFPMFLRGEDTSAYESPMISDLIAIPDTPDETLE